MNNLVRLLRSAYGSNAIEIAVVITRIESGGDISRCEPETQIVSRIFQMRRRCYEIEKGECGM